MKSGNSGCWSIALEVEIWRKDHIGMFSCFSLLSVSCLDLSPVWIVLARVLPHPDFSQWEVEYPRTPHLRKGYTEWFWSVVGLRGPYNCVCGTVAWLLPFTCFPFLLWFGIIEPRRSVPREQVSGTALLRVTCRRVGNPHSTYLARHQPKISTHNLTYITRLNINWVHNCKHIQSISAGKSTKLSAGVRACIISLHIWIKLCIVLAILGVRIMGNEFSSTLVSMRIRTSTGELDDMGSLMFAIATWWCGWFSEQMWLQLWSRLCESVRRRCTCSFASPVSLHILCGIILAWEESVEVVLRKHCRVSFFFSLHLVMTRIINVSHLPFVDFSPRFQNHILRFLHCIAWKLFICHFGHIQDMAFVGLFQLDPTSLSCESSRYVKNLQGISCCF